MDEPSSITKTAPPAGTPPTGTPPAGTPPTGAPPAGTPPTGAPPAGATPQNKVQNTLGKILAEMGELRTELRESQRLLPKRLCDATASDVSRLRYPVRLLVDHGPGTLLDNVWQHSPATGDEPDCHNTAETKCGLSRSKILRVTLSTSMLYVGGALNPRRDMAGWDCLESSGWVNRFIIHVPTLSPAGQHLRRINVGEASKPHRINISWDDADTNAHGWTQRLCFFVWEEAGPGRVMVSAAHATSPSRWRLELGRHVGTRPEDAGWVEKITFWVPEW